MEVADWFWLFLIYSFGGYGLEKAYARIRKSENQTRKCLLLLPLCPVYGLGLTAVLALPEAWRSWPWLIFSGAAVTTAVEYAYHWGCEVFLGVRFWNYAGLPGNLRGRVCLPFTLAWGSLTAGALALLQPLLERLVPLIPAPVTFAAMLIFTADAVCSARYLMQTHDPNGLHLRNLLPG